MSINEIKTVNLTCELDDVVNYALWNYGVSIVRDICIQNPTEEDLERVTLRITSEPELIRPFEQEIQGIRAGECCHLKNLNPSLNGEMLASLTEKCSCDVTVQVLKKQEAQAIAVGAEENSETLQNYNTFDITAASEIKDDRDKGLSAAKTADAVNADEAVNIVGTDVTEHLLATATIPLTILAYDQWTGLGNTPELLASFVMPNHPIVTKLVESASHYLEQWTEDPSLSGYQSGNPDRVRFMAAAVYAAIQKLNVAYAEPPASFETTGQRVRLADAVYDQRMGTCLDLTLLYAGCIEAMGLNPVLLITKGHIFAGVWLVDNLFTDCITDDPSQITKRMSKGIHEMVSLECTALCAGFHYSFEKAEEQAAATLNDVLDFFAALDVKRARSNHFAPMPVRVKTEDGYVIEHTERSDSKVTNSPDNLTETINFAQIQKEKVTKQTLWERNLLDLSMRNMLINMRITKSIVPILIDDASALEDALSDGSDFHVISRPEEMEWKESDVTPEYLTELGSFKDVIALDCKHKKLHAAYTDKDLGPSLTKIYRAARTSMEENGASTLYVALGLLRWTEDKKNAVKRYAPLVLLPATIVRKAANRGFTLRARDEDAQINVTLLEFLKQTFELPIYGLNPAPEDENGLDISRIFAIVRNAVMVMPGWDVVEAGFIGNFSFSQFVMWNDIHNKTEFLDHNKIVHGLMNGVVDWDCTIPDNVDTTEGYLPITVDASQLRAINMAAAGVSFVLHGPPGTGKSQTITAMISNALTKGKTVLFVAEKMAALEVVQKRLTALGISDFCLELHSNKATKKSVLDQLKRGLELEAAEDDTAYESRMQDISRMRENLDAYVKALHVKRPFGKSLRELMDLYETVPERGEELRFEAGFAAGLKEADLQDQMHSLERLIAAGREIGHPHNHPLSCVGQTTYSQSLKFDMEPVVNAWKDSLVKLADSEEALANCAGFKFEQASGLSGTNGFAGMETVNAQAAAAVRNIPVSADDMDMLTAFAKSLLTVAEIPGFLRRSENPDKEFYSCFTYMEKRDTFRKQKEEILKRWDENFLKMDMDSLESRYEQANRKILGKGRALGALEDELKNYASFAPAAQSIPMYVNEVKVFQKEDAEFEKTDKALPFEWRELLEKYETQEEMKAFQEKVDAQLSLVKRFAARMQSLEEYGRLETCEGLAKAMLADAQGESAARRTVDALLKLKIGTEERSNSRTSGTTMQAQAGSKSGGQLPEKIDENLCGQQLPGKIDELIALCDTLLAHTSEIKDWVIYKQFEDECIAQGLGPVCEAYANGMSHDVLIDVYRRSIYKAIILQVIQSENVLNEFTGTGFNARIEQFRKLDQEFMELTKKEMYFKLLHHLPHSNETVEISKELNILRRAISSNGRGLSIRSLFEQIPTVLPRLCPCMLMSPISVAQYLEAKNDLVDIVIFDEASQLPSCKAVGTLARGRDAVIVGDPNQMPPTTFFAGSAVDEDNLDMEDLDSILDDCLALGMPQSHLRWHYRSRHESLIAFSNQEFYENSMLTFPSVNDRERCVKLVPVEGCFNRGKGRVNEGEAKAIVEEIITRYRDPERTGQSVGVVTFNIQQQGLVEDLLQEAYRKDPEFERWACAGEEPLFVKNLENVQGDERDVILFSVAFGPDQNGKLSLNFGPLNKDGGWKRLNVAVTRARREMIAFSIMNADMIDLRRSRSKGVEAVRDFLAYAEKGMVQASNQDRVDTKNQGILNHICKALEEAGYRYQTHVGHSKFRVDIAVVNPYDEEEYLMGILLDGEYYRQSARTKDREVAQQDVLTGLGWNLHRVWTLDWWDNREKELKKLLEDAEQRKQEAFKKQQAKENAAPAETEVPENGATAEVPTEEAPENEATAEVATEEASENEAIAEVATEEAPENEAITEASENETASEASENETASEV